MTTSLALGDVGQVGTGSNCVRWVFTDRTGGVSDAPFDSLNLADHVGDDPVAVAANRRIVANRLGLSDDPDVVAIRAVHSAGVRVVTDAQPSDEPCDGLVTRQRNLALLALAADCAPVLIFNSSATSLGVLHCGWRGVVSAAPEALVSAMTKLGSTPGDLSALVGPTICGTCYEVDELRFEEFRASAPACVRRSEGRYYLDIRRAVTQALRDTGVRTGEVGGCTLTAPELFSHRRVAPSGRHGVMAVIT